MESKVTFGMLFHQFPVLLTIFLSSFSSVFATNNPPALLNFARNIFVPEDKAINSTIGILSARDLDGPSQIMFTIVDDATRNLVRLSDHMGDSTLNRSVEIILIHELDRDWQPSERKLYFNLADGQGSSSNNVPVRVALFIIDVNDEVPEFEKLRYKTSVDENAPVGTTVETVKAVDPDNGLGGTVTYYMEAVAQAADETYKNAFRIDQTKGEIIINSSLDFEKHNFYEFVIKAKDGLNNASKQNADFVVTVNDVQDSPPAFFNLPYSIVIPEDTAVGDPVLQVTALDGDRGVPNAIRYTFIRGDYQNFNLDENTGWITIKTELDRDASQIQQKGGVYDMDVMAQEMVTGVNYGYTNASTLVTITVSDVNDNTPTFNHAQYTATIQENMQNGVPVVFSANTIMSVNDMDQGFNSYFELTVEKDGQPFYEFAPLPKEAFSESTILIKVNNSHSLDYEKIESFTFQIVARELRTTEKRSSTATMTVWVEDVNDNQPIFTQTSYKGTVSENSPPGTTFITLKASDVDSGVYGEIMYFLRGGNGRFMINNSTGEVYCVGDLDREKVSQYYLTAEARDGGGFRTTVELQVAVTDQNDNAPIFVRDEYFAAVKEGSTSFLRGEVKVEATDSDVGNNSQVRYLITGTPPMLHDNFTVNNMTGVLGLTGPLDYEKLAPSLQGKILIEIAAVDLGSPSKQSLINVTLEVEDVNDERPVFNDTIYTGLVQENATLGTVVTKVYAHDLDGTAPNNEFVFRIDSGAQDNFRINVRTGEISVETTLNHEEREFYILNISATDRGPLSLIGYCSVKINVTDVNDDVPYFEKVSQSVTIPEDTPVNHVFLNYTAIDKDKDSQLRYQIIEDMISATDENGVKVDVVLNNITNYFGIHENSGGVYVKTNVDREKAERIVIGILVTDANAWHPPSSLQTATATLMITLSDVNDNPPKFIPSNRYHVNISEGRDINDPVMTLTATDADKNQLIQFTVDQDTSNSFQIKDPHTGVVSLKQKLDRETNPLVRFTVIARDSGSVVYSSEANITVSVIDTNDNSPVFKPYNNVYGVYEDAPNGTVIATVDATDSDSGIFAKIFYTLQVNNDDGHLMINTDKGEIIVKKPLDWETRPLYTVYVTATDNKDDPQNQRSQRTRAITIRVIDIDDQDPEFPRGPDMEPFILKSIPEEKSNVSCGSVDVAIDRDSDINNTLIFYYIIGGDMRDHFYLNKTGELILIKPIDRDGDKNPMGQTINFISLVIRASPLSHSTEDEALLSGRPVEYNSKDLTQLWVKVPIQDVNDHPPIFRQTNLRVGITRKTQFQEVIFALKDEVVDPDIGNNSVHTYHELSLVIHPDSLRNSIQSKPLTLSADGIVRTNMYFQADMSGYFFMTVTARDVLGQNDNATLRISLINDDQRVKVIFRMNPMQVKNFSEEFRSRLERITGYVIVVDKIQTHENADGQAEVEKTDMFIHGEVANPFRIVDAAELLSKIDVEAAALVSVLNDYNILQIVPTTSKVKEEDSNRLLIMTIILLAIILGLPCIIMIIVIFLIRKSYQRKLKAATAMAYGQDSDMQKLQLPGTNLHAYENANPIFLEKVLLEETADNDDNDSIDNNVVDPTQVKPYDVQEASMTFSGNKDIAVGSADMNLKAALEAQESSHRTSTFKPLNVHQNGSLKANLINKLQTTDI